jgi:hypothetical protein
MRSILWYIFTAGIPLLGFGTCTAGGVAFFRLCKSGRIGRVAAAAGYLIATSTPIILAIMAMNFGSYLANSRANYAFFGEGTWALLTLMVIYAGIAVVSNLVFWLTLIRSKRRANGPPPA